MYSSKSKWIRKVGFPRSEIRNEIQRSTDRPPRLKQCSESILQETVKQLQRWVDFNLWEMYDLCIIRAQGSALFYCFVTGTS